ncbi:hypothetical protein EAI_13383 [Harpegnathos saltator]|uniref:Myb/SANT-like DNA-binding domain-containing protein n=1 Tax=Harpegnathos saltator TaxID=610380 RepID=E2BB64_HARSA|nr:hypothetical protein EAI_13383 [Harpegnathos saltator]
MENVKLIRGKHILSTDKNNQSIYDSQGSLLVCDVTKGNVITISVSEEFLTFLNLQVITDNNEPENFNFEPNSGSTSLATQSSTQHASWKDDNAIRRLIYAWKEYENNFKNGKCKSSEVWKKIASVLQNENSQWLYTGIQCENKFKELRKKYVKVKDYNKQSGNSPMTSKFFNEFEEILGDKPCMQPVALASSLKKRPLTFTSQDSDTENSKDDSDRKKKVRKTRLQRELGEWSATLHEDVKYREEAREQRYKEMIAISD